MLSRSLNSRQQNQLKHLITRTLSPTRGVACETTQNKAPFVLTHFRHSYTLAATFSGRAASLHCLVVGVLAASLRDSFQVYTFRKRSKGASIMSQREFAIEGQGVAAVEYEDRSIKCVDCGESFIWTGGEQVFFHDKGLKNEPKRCKPCKQAKNERLAAIAAAQTSGIRQRIEVSVDCAQCGQTTTVPFYPSQGRPVYCRSCFLAGRAEANGAGVS